MSKQDKLIKILLQALKIGIGSSLAIYVAHLLNLVNPASAGIITLLTLMTNRVETFRLSFLRIITFILSVLFVWVLFSQHIKSDWVSYGLFIFFIVAISEAAGWRATISVNAVVGTHFLMAKDYSLAFVWNEFMLVLIGITIAIVLNLFQLNRNIRTRLIRHMRETEEQLQMVLDELARYLCLEEFDHSVWDDAIVLEEKVQRYVELAHEYKSHSFQKHSDYYIYYFEMRLQQCSVIHNLHYQIKQIRYQTEQAHIIADYMRYMKQFVTELNVPTEQLDNLKKIYKHMQEAELPKSREEFESRAILYHILMDIQEFLIFKKRFIEKLSEEHVEVYWGRIRYPRGF